MATVRFFAAARAAAGTDTVTPPREVGTLAELVDFFANDYGPELARVAAHCSYLVDGVRATALDTSIGGASTIDVLPPFAGG